MKKNIRISIIIIAALLVVFSIVKIRMTNDEPPQAEDDEIKVNIRLNLDEDIGLLLISYDVNGTEGTGGISNANHSLLKKDSRDLYWSFEKQHLETVPDIIDMTLSFAVVTEYFEPNYNNNYPEECVIPVDVISFQANFGEIYYMTITGSKIKGYQLSIDES